MPGMQWKLFGFCSARMGNLDPTHSVRPSGNVCTLREGDDEEMADEKEGNIERLESAEGAISEEE